MIELYDAACMCLVFNTGGEDHCYFHLYKCRLIVMLALSIYEVHPCLLGIITQWLYAIIYIFHNLEKIQQVQYIVPTEKSRGMSTSYYFFLSQKDKQIMSCLITFKKVRTSSEEKTETKKSRKLSKG